MNIIANNVASKLFVAFVAASMLFTLATPAKAATAEELQAQIAALMAQISALQGGAPAMSAAACTFTRALTVGSEGADVKCLQDYLTPTYFTNAGGSTGYFGPVTAAAVAAWQTANGVMPAAGYFGPVSQAKYNSLMAAVPPTTGGGSPTTGGNDDDEDMGDLSGEASLDTTDLTDGDDVDVEEGSTADIAEFSAEFTDGDARITRLDLDFGVTGTEEDAWDTFETVALLVDGDEVASKSVDDKDAWLDEDAMTLRFAGLDVVAAEDEEITFVIQVTTLGSVDNLPASWNVDVTSMRYLDADDVSTTETVTETAVDFDVEEAGGDDELIIKSATDNPAATTIPLDASTKSDWETVMAFDLDTDDSVNDIEVTDLRVDLAFTEDGTTATSSSLLLSDVRLMLDGSEIGDATVNHGTTASTTFDFDSGELVIDAGDRVTIEVQAKFLALGTALEGSTVEGVVDTDGLSAEGADDLAGGQLSGSASGKEHTLRTQGAILDVTSVDETYKANAADVLTDDEGVFKVVFTVEAFENDLWINKTAASSSALSGTAGVNFIIEDSNGVQVATGTESGSLSSSAETDGTRFKVNEGDTETFTLTVEYDPAADGYFQLQLVSFNFATSNGNPTEWQAALPAESYQTDQLSIEN